MADQAEGSKSGSSLRQFVPHMTAVRTGAAVLGIVVSVGAAAVVKRTIYLWAKPVERLHPRLRAAGGSIDGLKVTFGLNPYDHLTTKRAVILLGRNQEGKTTLLRTAVPWYRRWKLGGFYGVYLNGAEGRGVDSFKEWQATQMFGMTTTAGSEIKRTLVEHREGQWFRRFLEAMGRRSSRSQPS